MFGDFEHTKGLRKCAAERIGKTIDEIYGEEKANELRAIFFLKTLLEKIIQCLVKIHSKENRKMK